MVTIKKPIRKTEGIKPIKPIKPEPLASEEVQNEVIEHQEEAVHTVPDSELDFLEDQQPELQEHQEEANQLEQQPEPLESQSKATQPKHPLVNNPEVKVEEKTLASIEVVENGIAWQKTLKPIVPKQKVGFTEIEGAVTVVNDRNSKRVKLKGVVTEGLGYPDYIKFYVTDEEFVVQASAVDEEGSYKLRFESKRKCLIYNSEVIELLTEMFELDFTKSTSQTFGEVKFECIEGVEYAIIS